MSIENRLRKVEENHNQREQKIFIKRFSMPETLPAIDRQIARAEKDGYDVTVVNVRIIEQPMRGFGDSIWT